MELIDVAKLKDCARELESLGSDTEPEFLQIGENLNAVADICFAMSGNAEELTQLANFTNEAEANGGSFIDDTRHIFGDISHMVESTINSLGQGEHLLADLKTQVRKLKEPTGQLYITGKTFKVLSISIKVESSRQESSRKGFTLLSEEVSQISQLVLENCRNCTDKTTLIERDIDLSGKVMEASGSSFDDSGEEAIAGILDALESVGNKSETLAADIQERTSSMVQGISDVVMAMQFHDITRQQLENVAKSLDEVCTVAATVGENSDDRQKKEKMLEIHSTMSIQVAHLNSIFEQILGARSKIGSGLETTKIQARHQADDARALLDIEGTRRHGGSVLHKLEQEIDAIVLTLNKSLEVVSQAADVSREVYENVAVIGDFVNTIEEIALDVKILAINAMVEALKTGETGKPLIVLAEELSILSQLTRNRANNFIELLQQVIDGTQKQLDFCTRLEENQKHVDAMVARAKEVSGSILSTMQKINGLAVTMDKASQNLNTRIKRLLPSIKFPEVMGNVIDRNWQYLCNLLNLIEEQYPEFTTPTGEVEKMLKKLMSKYVMDRERMIHAQVTGGDTAMAADDDIELFDDIDLFDEQPQRSHQEKEDDFGDNVDLF